MVIDEVRTLSALMKPGGAHHRALVRAAAGCVRGLYAAWGPLPRDLARRLDACVAWAEGSERMRREQAWLRLGASADLGPAVDLAHAVARAVGDATYVPEAFEAFLRARALQSGDPRVGEREAEAAVRAAIAEASREGPG